MNILESLIDFQNKAEKDFKDRKSAGNILSYILALTFFFIHPHTRFDMAYKKRFKVSKR